VFHGPHSRDWYLLDRLFISFQIFGFYGMLAWVFRDTFQRMLNKWWPGLLGLWLVGLIWTNWELFSYGFPVNLRNAPYYKPSMTGYALAVIGLLAALCEIQVRRQR
ncbi:acyltransferase, partial [Streptococcus thermophilus]|nr:acyltransferase [Streptococcus thermophilus]